MPAVAVGGDGVAEDLAFHRALGEATGNPQFACLLGFLEQYLREAMRVTRGNEARRRRLHGRGAKRAPRHRRCHRRARRAAARRCATEHLLRGARRLEEGGVISAPPSRRRSAHPARKAAGQGIDAVNRAALDRMGPSSLGFSAVLRRYRASGRVDDMSATSVVPERRKAELPELDCTALFVLPDDFDEAAFGGCEYRPRDASATSASHVWFQPCRDDQ